MLFKRSVIPMHIQYDYIYTWRNSPGFPSPLAGSPLSPLCVPFVFPSTYLAPSSCDRNRPPPSQVACKLTPFAPPFTQLTHSFQIPRTPNCPAPNNDDLGNIPALAIRNTPLLRSSSGAGEARTAPTPIFLTQQTSRTAPRPHPHCLNHRLAVA